MRHVFAFAFVCAVLAATPARAAQDLEARAAGLAPRAAVAATERHDEPSPEPAATLAPAQEAAPATIVPIFAIRVQSGAASSPPAADASAEPDSMPLPGLAPNALESGRASGAPDPAASTPSKEPADADDSFRWRSALEQSLLFVGLQHTFRMTELKTRRELDGPFFKDWFDAVKSLKGWNDGGRQFTNYVAHPMQGSITGFIQVHNDPKGVRQEFSFTKAYWKSRMKAMAWSAACSTQFELGPLSQASLGNVGAGEFEAKKMAYVDLVITPTMGTAWLVAEDAVDKGLVRRIERRTDNAAIRVLARMALNPMRSVSNTLRFKVPWYRDVR